MSKLQQSDVYFHQVRDKMLRPVCPPADSPGPQGASFHVWAQVMDQVRAPVWFQVQVYYRVRNQIWEDSEGHPLSQPANPWVI
jgi:hypothetical protein